MTKNHEHVAVHTDGDTMYWALLVPSTAETCEEQTQEMINLCEQLFQTFGEFVTPTGVEFYVPCFPSGHELPASMYDDVKIKTEHRELHDSAGISFDEVRAAMQIDDCPSRWIPKIEFDGNKVLVELENGPVIADRTSHTVEYRKKQPVDQNPPRDPIELSLLHGPNSREGEIESEYVTSVVVHLLSDIWFEDTELGHANARNLAAFLERIEQTLPVEKINRSTDWYPVEELETIY